MDPLLERQLRRFGLEADNLPTDPEAWRSFLERVSESYSAADRGRYLLERSLHISSTEMKALYDSLRASSESRVAAERDRLRTIIDSLTDGLCTLDGEGRLILLNGAGARYLAASEDDLLLQPVLHRFVSDQDDSLPLNRLLSLSADATATGTARLGRPDLPDLPVAYVISPVRQDSRRLGWVFVFRDITERHLARQAVRRSESHFENLFRSSALAIFQEDFTEVGRWLEELRRQGVTDLAAHLAEHPDQVFEAIARVRVTDVNPASVRLLEASEPGELLGSLEPATFDAPALESFVGQLQALWNGEDRFEAELEGLTLTGRRLTGIFHWSVARIDGELDLSRVLVAITDISARKEAERQLAELVRSKDAFLASVSHELRTPLTAVYASAEILRDMWSELDDADAVELIEMLVTQSRELGHIVEDLLVAARADLGHLTILPEPVDLAKEVREVVATLAGAADDVEVEGTAMADPLRLRQILRNLLTNASRYGGAEVKVRTRQENGHVVVNVVDNGEGIPVEEWDAIFEPYYSAHSLTGLPGSVGLGLAVSRQLARMMGGDLSYRYEQDLSVFELVLPSA